MLWMKVVCPWRDGAAEESVSGRPWLISMRAFLSCSSPLATKPRWWCKIRAVNGVDGVHFRGQE